MPLSPALLWPLATLGWVLGSSGSVDAPVRFEGPPACPSDSEVRRRIEARLGRPLADEEPVRAAMRVEHEAEAFVLGLRIDAGAGTTERVLRDADCEVLVEAAVLMVAMAIDPDLRPVAPEPSPIPEPPEPSPTAEQPEPTPVAPPVEVARPRPRSSPVPPRGPERPSHRPRVRSGQPWRPSGVGLGVWTGVQFGPLPRAGAGFGGHVAVLWPRLRVELGGEAWLPTEARLDDAPEFGGDLWLALGRGRACVRSGQRRLEFDACTGPELGALRGRGIGVDVPQTSTLLWSAWAAALRLSWSPIRRVAVFAQPELAVPFGRHRYAIDGLGFVHRVAPLASRFHVGVEVRLP